MIAFSKSFYEYYVFLLSLEILMNMDYELIQRLVSKSTKKALTAEALYKQKQLPVISKPTFYRYLRSRGVEIK